MQGAYFSTKSWVNIGSAERNFPTNRERKKFATGSARKRPSWKIILGNRKVNFLSRKHPSDRSDFHFQIIIFRTIESAVHKRFYWTWNRVMNRLLSPSGHRTFS